MPAIKEGSTHYCKSCGIATTDKGHLCDPAPIIPEEAFACDYCGKVVTDPRHVCKPMTMKVDYSCKSCGRVSDRQDKLCDPTKLEA